MTKFFKLILTVALSLFALNIFAECKCRPSNTCWPSQNIWQQFAKTLDGQLVKPVLPLKACKDKPESQACQKAKQTIKNPFSLQNKPGSTESQGLLDAWQAVPSTYAVEAQTTQDVVKAVNFARKHHFRLVLKGAGHDYLGRSVAPDSLLIWTHNMRDTSFIDDFKGKGCDKKQKGVPAISVGAGTRWLEAYTKATTENDMYVQGGGCVNVGAAGGFIQGGGFGSFSREYGTGAAGILEAEVVTANGQVVIANDCQHQDLFWALKGGGASTYGVVTKLVLKAHPLPKTMGVYEATIKASSDESYQTLIEQFLTFFKNQLNSRHWGEQFAFNPDNSLTIFLMFQGLDEEEINTTWKPFISWLKNNKQQYEYKHNHFFIKPNKMWDLKWWQQHHPEFVTINTGPDAREGEYWWTPNSGEVYKYWYAYQSWWFPYQWLDKTEIKKTADIFFKASRTSSISIHMNKGLYHASDSARKSIPKTSTHPKVLDSVGLILMSAGTLDVVEEHTTQMKNKANAINKAMNHIKSLAPNAGTYANEADYFQDNWQYAFYGTHYQKLLKIKNKYDPNGLFYCHHCVGSESWDDDGFCSKS